MTIEVAKLSPAVVTGLPAASVVVSVVKPTVVLAPDLVGVEVFKASAAVVLAPPPPETSAARRLVVIAG